MLRSFPPSFPASANAKFKPLDPMSKDQLELQAKDGTIQCDHPTCKEPLDPSLCTDRCVVVECDAGVVNEQCEQGCVVDRAYGCPFDKQESSFPRANDDSSVCPSTSPQTATSPIHIPHNIDPALVYTTSSHTEDSGHIVNGVHALADLHLGLPSPVLTCLWGDCNESFQSRSDLLSHLHAVHLQPDVIQAHKRATLEPPPYHGFLNPNPPMTPNLICDWEHCHEELSPFKAPGPSNLNGFDASLLALSNHIVNEHFGIDPYGQHFFNAQQPLSPHQSYMYQQQQNQGALYNYNGTTPPRSLRWPIQEEREWWNPPKVDYFGQSNEPEQGRWSNMSQSSTWPEDSPNHGRIERNSTARYDPYSASCRETSSIRFSQSKDQGKPHTNASPRTTLRKSLLALRSNMASIVAGANKPASNGVGLSAHTASAANSGTFCCHWIACPEAAFDFGSSNSLTAHITAQHVGSGRKTYDCFWDACDRNIEKSFPSKQKILRHLQSHTGHRPFECELCHERFSEQASLQQHMRRHTNEKPYMCDFPGCGKAFAIAGGLRIHKRVHNGEKPFKCSECGRGFAESSNLSKHMRIHTGERPYACDFPSCGKSFTRADQLARHTATHTKGTKQGTNEKGSDSSEHTD